MSAPNWSRPDLQSACLGRPRPTPITDSQGRSARVIDGEPGLVVLVPAPCRRRPAPPLRYVSEVGHRFRSLYPMGKRSPLGSVHLGYHPTAGAAHRAAVAFRRHGPTDETYPEILVELIRREMVPGDLLPKWVYAIAGGYAARHETRAAVIEVPGPLPTPTAAFLAILRMVPRPPAVEPHDQRTGRHWGEALEVARRYRGGESPSVLADEYGVHLATIYRLLDSLGVPRRAWK